MEEREPEIQRWTAKRKAMAVMMQRALISSLSVF